MQKGTRCIVVLCPLFFFFFCSSLCPCPVCPYIFRVLMRLFARPSPLRVCLRKGLLVQRCVCVFVCVSQWHPCIVFHPPPQQEETCCMQHDARYPCVILHECHKATPTATRPTRAEILVMTHNRPIFCSLPPPTPPFCPFIVVCSSSFFFGSHLLQTLLIYPFICLLTRPVFPFAPPLSLQFLPLLLHLCFFSPDSFPHLVLPFFFLTKPFLLLLFFLLPVFSPLHLHLCSFLMTNRVLLPVFCICHVSSVLPPFPFSKIIFMTQSPDVCSRSNGK